MTMNRRAEMARMEGLSLVLLIAGCATIADIHEGTPRGGVACANVEDCAPDVPECREAVACVESLCAFEDAISGKPLSIQQAGDCSAVVCDGSGNAIQIPAPQDVHDDGNPCTIDTCSGVTPVSLLRSEAPCYSGPPGAAGVGICTMGIQQCDADGRLVGMRS